MSRSPVEQDSQSVRGRNAISQAETPAASVCPDCGASNPPPSDRSSTALPRFCSACGQELVIKPLQLSQISRQLIGDLYSFELPILRTLRDLCFNPGGVARAWLNGRRRSYIHPVKLAIILGVVIALCYEPLQRLRHTWHDGGPLYETGLAHHNTQFFGLFSLAIMIPIALLLTATARALKMQHPWLHWYVVGLYAYGLGTALQLGVDACSLFLPATTFAWLSTTNAVLPAALLVWAAAGFADRGMRWRAGLAALLSQVLALAAIAAASSAFTS